MYPLRTRAWCQEWNQWVYGYYEEVPVGIGKPHGIMHTFNDWNLNGHEDVEPESKGLFTGKQDADGKDIYEGDILEYFTIKKIVAWDNVNSMWGLKRTLDEKAKLTQQLATVELEKSHIIGNIFQNPDLIGAKQ